MAQNNIALVTGGSRGLGKDMALALARKGLDVILTYNRQKDEALSVVAEIAAFGQKAVALPLDVSDASTFAAFFSLVSASLRDVWQTSAFQFLINNAGIGIHATFASTTEEQFDTLVRVQLKGPYFLTQHALPLLADGGGIVNISTGLARFAYPGYSAYASMKGGIEVLTRYLAVELGPRKIRVNTVAPGAIETDFGGGVVRDNTQVNARIASITALGRVGLPEDIGSVVAFLCTDDARWVNAQRIEVSGGQSL